MKTTNRIISLTALFLGSALIVTPALAGQAEINEIERAAGTLNIDKLKQINTRVTNYDLALSQYRLALSANLKGQTELADSALDESMTALETLNEQSPDNVEVKALLAQVYGYKVALSPMKGIYYGPKSGAMLAEAEALAPNNPRVLLVKGIGAINTPPMFGGSVDVALNAFNQAIEAYASDAYSNYHWGFAEAHTWRGLVHQQKGDLDKAKADWQRALEIDPEYGWAKSVLANSQG